MKTLILVLALSTLAGAQTHYLSNADDSRNSPAPIPVVVPPALQQIHVVGSHVVRTDRNTTRTNCSSTVIGNSLDTECHSREQYQDYTITTGIDTRSTLRFEMARLGWTGGIKTSGWGGDSLPPGYYSFRFVDGNTIEAADGKKRIRFVVLATYCTQELPGVCAAGEKLSVGQ